MKGGEEDHTLTLNMIVTMLWIIWFLSVTLLIVIGKCLYKWYYHSPIKVQTHLISPILSRSISPVQEKEKPSYRNFYPYTDVFRTDDPGEEKKLS